MKSSKDRAKQMRAEVVVFEVNDLWNLKGVSFIFESSVRFASV